jgi:hypothetical protein
MASLKIYPDYTASPSDEDNSAPFSHSLNIEEVGVKPTTLDHHRSYASVMQGLTLNLNEPWERSLSRLLEDVSYANEPNTYMANLSSNNSSGNTSVPIITSPTSTMTATAVPELMLLSRTESRDYALEIEGDSSSGTIMNLSMDDTTTSSGVASHGGDKTTSPIRSRLHHPVGSIYRKTLSKKNLTVAGRKSLFDDSDNDDESDDTAASGKCRLTHKFSSDSLLLFYEQQQQYLEDRGEQEDESERKVADESFPNERSFSIRKASAICDEYDNDDYYYSNYNSSNNYIYDARRLLIPELRSSRPSTHRHPPANLYLPTF